MILIASTFVTVVVPRMEDNVKTAPMTAPRAQATGVDASGLGQAISQASKLAMAEYADEQAKANAASVMQASASSYEIETDLTKQAKELTGKAVVGSADVLLKDYDDRHGKLRMGLANDSQRAAFDKLLVSRRHSFDTAINDHEMQQTKAYNVSEATSATEGASLRAALYHERPDLFEVARQEMERNARAEMSIKGFGPDSESTKERLAKLNSKVYEDLIQAKMVKDPTAATREFEKLKEKGLLLTDAVERLAPKIQVFADAQTALTQGDAIFSKHVPGTVNDVLRLDKMREEARSFEGSPHVKELIEKRVESLGHEYEQQRRINEESASQRIYGLGKDKKTPYLSLVTEINADGTIDNKTKASLLDWADRTYGISEAKREARAEARAEGKMQKNLAYMSNLLSFQNDYLGGKYGTMQPGQVAKHLKELGPFTDNAMQFVNHVNNDPAAKVTDDALKDNLRILSGDPQYKGLLPKVDNANDKDKAKLAILQQEVQSIMAASKKADAKPMNINKAILTAIQKVRTDTGFFSDTDEPLYLLGTNFATKYGKDPKTWPKSTQDAFIRKQFYTANPNGRLTPQKHEEYRLRLLEEADGN